MQRNSGSIIIASLFGAVALMEVAVAAGYPFAGLVGPWILGGIALVLCAAQLVMDFKGWSPPPETKPVEIRGERYLELAAWFTGLLLGTYLVGMTVAFPLFVLLYVKVHRWSWKLSLALSLGSFAMLYGFFQRGLGIILYRGVFFE